MKLGLVLEGGAMRGVFTAGVLDLFLDQGITVDCCVAVSAGACLACSYLSRQPGRGYQTSTGYLGNPDYCSIRSLLRTGDLFGVDFLYHKIPEQLYPIDNQTFMQGKTDFYSVITNCRTGKPEYPKIEDLHRDINFIRASSSLPLLSRLVKIDRNYYFDGGVSDPIPLRKAFDLGCDRVITVLTRPRDYRKRPEQMLPLIRLKYKDFPNLAEAMKHRYLVYNNELRAVAASERAGKALVIAPPRPLEIRRAEKNRDRLLAGYACGYESAKELLPELRRFCFPTDHDIDSSR